MDRLTQFLYRDLVNVVLPYLDRSDLLELSLEDHAGIISHYIPGLTQKTPFHFMFTYNDQPFEMRQYLIRRLLSHPDEMSRSFLHTLIELESRIVEPKCSAFASVPYEPDVKMLCRVSKTNPWLTRLLFAGSVATVATLHWLIKVTTPSVIMDILQSYPQFIPTYPFLDYAIERNSFELLHFLIASDPIIVNRDWDTLEPKDVTTIPMIRCGYIGCTAGCGSLSCGHSGIGKVLNKFAPSKHNTVYQCIRYNRINWIPHVVTLTDDAHMYIDDYYTCAVLNHVDGAGLWYLLHHPRIKQHSARQDLELAFDLARELKYRDHLNLLMMSIGLKPNASVTITPPTNLIVPLINDYLTIKTQ